VGRIRVLLVDDHAVVRQGLRAFLESEEDIEIVAEASNGAEAVELATKLGPDVILLDLVMPGMDGSTAIVHLSKVSPDSHVLVLTSFGEDEKLFPAITAGAEGYLLKDTLPEDLALAIRAVARGKFLFDSRIAGKVMRGQAHGSKRRASCSILTAREIDVLKLITQGQSNKQIANELGISIKTVKTHVSNILNKLSLSDRTQAALFALDEGLMPPCEIPRS
jgi:NarL family two-component system response regulator LiaR